MCPELCLEKSPTDKSARKSIEVSLFQLISPGYLRFSPPMPGENAVSDRKRRNTESAPDAPLQVGVLHLLHPLHPLDPTPASQLKQDVFEQRIFKTNSEFLSFKI